MESSEIRKRFLDFFATRGHTIVPSSSLIPNDPSVLLTTAGMQQFKPYYTGQADPMKDFGSRNTASIQKSFRTSDIDEVGDESHLTFFEMLGNFAFGGYFKEEAIRYAYDFFKTINLPIEYVTVFEGDPSTGLGQVLPPDVESERIWRDLGVSDIRQRSRADNFWGPTGNEGPCGPTTEVYARDTEIWNIVFNQYYCKPDKSLVPLQQNGVDTGMGLERLTMVLQNKANIFETDLFQPLIALLPDSLEIRKKRIMADHLRGSAFLLADGVRPSNKGAGYVLRRLMRRTMVYEKLHTLPAHLADSLLHEVVHQYGGAYPELLKNGDAIRREFASECEKFSKTIEQGIKEFNRHIMTREPDKRGTIGRFHDQRILYGNDAFDLYQTFGFPREVMKDLAIAAGGTFDDAGFDLAIKQHQEISRSGQERKFGGHGLLLNTGELKAADEAELAKVTRLHTATHLLNTALRKILGPEVRQDGSDITVARTRFDFTFPRKLAPQELRQIEDLVNDVIRRNLPVAFEEMAYEEAIKTDALSFFREKYPPQVKVYTVADPKSGEIFSKELCGGPHVTHTGEIGRVKIIKEESSSAGVRRIRAVVEP